MDAFVSRKRRKPSPPDHPHRQSAAPVPGEDEDSTDFKLALLASLHPRLDHGILLEALLACDGSVERASQTLGSDRKEESPRKRLSTVGYQSSLSAYRLKVGDGRDPSGIKRHRLPSRKGTTLHLYSPEDIENNTPCSIIHNFLPPEEADALLRDLLHEAPSFQKDVFKLFDKVVESPHTMCFYVDSWDEVEQQKTDYVYNGSSITDVRRTLPEMHKVAKKVQAAVNAEIRRRIGLFSPDGKKLKYQSPHEWKPNAAFVNCYDGGAESVGYHSDQLTYLGPRAVIGSLSLGVAREFRVRKIVPVDDEPPPPKQSDNGQIAIHLPHNSLVVMHASMQEEWKHSIAPAQAIDPHPIAGNKRINITYRHYKESLHPRCTPRCKCNIPTVLRCVQRKKENRGRYMWMCHANYTPGKEGCSFFQWAEFDDDGEPPWARKVSRQ